MFDAEIEKIKSLDDYDSSKLYMLEKNSNSCGFFYFDKKICFLCKSETNNELGESTTFLDFRPYTHISSVENTQSFESGRYDVLMLKEKENEEMIESFVGFCRTYAANPVLSFYDFIHSIIELFQLPSREAVLNCIGLYGELSYIKIFYEKGIDLSFYWHKQGVYSKYDFNLNKFNIEIKTSLKDNTIFNIKHNQLFNSEKIYVGLVSIKESGNVGNSLSEIVTYFQNEEPFKSNLLFQLALAKELKKKIDLDEFEKKRMCTDIYCFDASTIDTIKNIPYCISDVSYSYDFDLTESFDTEKMLSIIKQSI